MRPSLSEFFHAVSVVPCLVRLRQKEISVFPWLAHLRHCLEAPRYCSRPLDLIRQVQLAHASLELVLSNFVELKQKQCRAPPVLLDIGGGADLAY